MGCVAAWLALGHDAIAGPHDWPDLETERPLVLHAGLIEIRAAYSENRATKAFATDSTLEPTQPGQPSYVRGLQTEVAYGLFRGFETSLTVPYIFTRRTEVLTGEPTGRGLGRIRVASTYQLPVSDGFWLGARGAFLLPTTDTSLRPDPNSPQAAPLKDNLAGTVDVLLRRNFSGVQLNAGAGYVHTFANVDDIKADRAPEPAWYAQVDTIVQARRAYLGLGARFDRAGRTEVGGEAVPRSDAWTVSITPSVGFHANDKIDLEAHVMSAMAGKNAAKNTVWSLGFTGRF